MYSTCIFCHSDLGANDSIEHFPIGRRLAFDAARGRLWVVCRRCERWNLTPIEERWEAIEECERNFAATRLRVSTDNIGLARIREGLELVRIGAPQRPEMAAWRYGDQFGRRRRKYVMWNAAGVAAAIGIIVLGPVTGIIAGSSFSLINLANLANSAYQKRRVRTRIALSDFPDPIAIRANELDRVSIVEANGGWALRVPFRTPTAVSVSSGKGRDPADLRRLDRGVELSVLLSGDEALRAVGNLLPAMNSTGAKRSEVESAVRLISDTPEATGLFARYADEPLEWNWRKGVNMPTSGRRLASLPREVRLALEMVSHEESERRALEGELLLLQDAWQQAEEIAAIADDLFISDETRARLSSLKRAGDGEKS